ncbi:MAG: 6-bladed beta-propeller [Verrucomicrobiae bacterium]|nr:6-bladed beta-propeller [Verrucomicrobiae bacterium]
MSNNESADSRRDFLRSLAVALTGAALTPALPSAAAEEPMILGQGSYRYRVLRNWGVLDRQTPVKDCHGMVQSRDGRIFLLTNHTANNVIIYNAEGRLLGKWGTQWPGAHGLTLFTEDGEERLFITDHDRHEVYKTTLDGVILMTLGWPEGIPPYRRTEQYKPTHVAVNGDGTFYVADGYGLNYILHYDPRGRLIRVFGGDDDSPAALKCAHGLHVDRRDPSRPELLITSRSQSAIKRFSPAGEYLGSISLAGAMPCFIVPWGEHLVVPHLKGATRPTGSDTENGFVSILDRQNRIVANLAAGAPVYEGQRLQPMSANTTVFRYPHGLLVDREENLYVAQWNSGQTYPIKLERLKG